MTMCVMLQLSQMNGQVADKGGLVEVYLGDLPVLVLPGFELNGQHTYYYLPTNLRLASRRDLTPEFSFMTYEKDSVVEGAILHFLLAWGLSPSQEKELERKLRMQIDSNAIVAGALPVEAPNDQASVRITGPHKLAQILGTKWSMPPVVPVIPGTKMALSYKLDANEALMIEEALASSKWLDSIQLNMLFQFKGGYHKWWLNRFGENYYELSTSLKTVLAPVMTGKKK